ncbi:5'-nucleotidase [Coxiella-like endosymbiont]|nr:5'-nucleotidase [Coxiella-like endosymbiont]
MNSGLYIAFDGDAILFSDEAERVSINKKDFLHLRLIKKAVNHPISEDPFKGFLKALQQLQSQFPVDQYPIRTDLVTARHPPRARMRHQNFTGESIRIHESLFLGGIEKSNFLPGFNADIFLMIKKDTTNPLLNILL